MKFFPVSRGMRPPKLIKITLPPDTQLKPIQFLCDPRPLFEEIVKLRVATRDGLWVIEINDRQTATKYKSNLAKTTL